MNLYITGDRVGETSGGGIVTHHEWKALCDFSTEVMNPRDNAMLFDRDHFYHLKGKQFGEDPWRNDNIACETTALKQSIPIAHFYAGTFSDTIRMLKDKGTKVTYTAAAHDIQKSRREHEKFGIPFAERYPHLVIPEQWERYVRGYLEADVLICPSSHSAAVMRSYGYAGRIEIIPHGVLIPPGEPAPLPKTFTVGYLGSYGPDKGVIYLLQAWKRLNYSDAVLVLGGRDSQSPFVRGLIEQYGGGNIVCLGWVHDPIHFYNSLSLYVQPSVSEGFGIEVLEAYVCGRAVVCSNGVGASDIVPEGFQFTAGDEEELAGLIDFIRRHPANLWDGLETYREIATNCSWDKIRKRYVEVWMDLIK